MAESRSTVAVVPLNGTNYVTWKVQCKMALMKEGLWKIVEGTEVAPVEAAAYAKFVGRRDRALAIVVLSIKPRLLYLIGEPDDPERVWKKLCDQFLKKTWANKLELRKRLYSLRLKEGESVQEHIRRMTELFSALAEVDAPLSEEDRVVYLLASLPESFGVLVTALEASPEVPKMDVVTERLLHEERKMLSREKGSTPGDEKAMMSRSKDSRKKGLCFRCGKPGHYKRDCRMVVVRSDGSKDDVRGKPKGHKAKVTTEELSDGEALVVSNALTVGSMSAGWIVDSGTTSHMCCHRDLFVDYEELQKPERVTLGDGRSLDAVGRGTVSVVLRLPGGETKVRNLHAALHVPGLSYNLVSVSKVSEAGRVVRFLEKGCQIFNSQNKVIATASRCGSLYFLDCLSSERMNVANVSVDVWHRRYGHLNARSLRQLSVDGLVDGFDSDISREIGFCESCTEGKHHRSPFPGGSGTRAEEPLNLVHTDVCGKLNTKSLGGAEYVLTFTDDATRYVWVYFLKRKSEVFSRFLEWKTMVERMSGRQLKALRSDNGGEYTSGQFVEYLKSEGIRHELTVPKTPQQNGVAERLNRTLIEMTRAMLSGSNLPQNLWAETLSTAVYLRNHSPTKAVKGMTPFEALHGKRPDVGQLRVFGCASYAHIAKDERKKLDMTARRCVLVGYGTEVKGYRLYDPVRVKVFYSRDVRFNEDEVGLEKESGGVKPVRYVELEISGDEVESQMDDAGGASVEGDGDSGLPTQRRSGRVRQRPDYFVEGASVASRDPEEPRTFGEALSSPSTAKWEKAMEVEMESLRNNDVWELVELPVGWKVVGSKWVYKVKVDSDGRVERYKARLVAQGYTQQKGADYDETFCPVVRMESVRTVIGWAVRNGLKLHQLDVTAAFLNGELEEEVYMRQPEGFVAEGREHLVCKLRRSIYGLKQSPRCWNFTLDSYLKKIGFLQSTSDPCVYITAGEEMAVIGVYVDDIVIACKSDERLEQIKQDICQTFDVKDLGKLHHFLGMKIVQNDATGDVWMGQPAYIERVLKKYGMQNAKSVSTPVDLGTKLAKFADGDQIFDHSVYQSAVGSLLYLSTGTRPDIAFAVSNVAKFSSNPGTKHWKAVKRILRYLKGTAGLGLLYLATNTDELHGYSDSDWAGDLDDRKSTSGYLFRLSGAPISWRSRKQTSVALSTAEAEYVSLSSATQEVMWLRRLTSELKNGPTKATVLYEDNQSAIAMTRNAQFHGRAKHIAIRNHFVREKVSEGVVELKYCPTDRMIADMLTKGLSCAVFERLRNEAGIVPLPVSFSIK